MLAGLTDEQLKDDFGHGLTKLFSAIVKNGKQKGPIEQAKRAFSLQVTSSA